MAKRKVKINIKMDLLSECKPAIVKRLLGPSFKLAPKDHHYVHKSTVEIIDPSWDSKAFSQAVYASQRRWMQILASRVIDGLKKVDKDKKPPTEINNLKKVIGTTAKQIRDQADYFIKQTAEEASKDAPKWDKGRDVKDFVEEIEGERDDFVRSIKKMTVSFGDAIKDIENSDADLMMIYNRREHLDGSKKDGDDASQKKELKKKFEKLDADRKRKREEIRDRLKEMGATFSTYRQSRGTYQKLLKSSKKKLHRMIDAKFKDGDKQMNKLNLTFKNIGQAAETYVKYLDKNDEQMMQVLKPLLKFSTEKGFDPKTGRCPYVFNKIDVLVKSVPDAGGGADQKLFSLIAQAKKELKKIKAARK